MPGKIASIVFLVLLMMSVSASAVEVHLVRADGAGILCVNAGGSVNARAQDYKVLPKTGKTSTYVYLGRSLQFSNLTNYIGDLLVNGSQTLLISDCEFNITGQLTISDQAQVTLRNCTFISNWNENDQPDPTFPGGNYYWRTRHIIVEDQASLNMIDSNVTLLASEKLGIPFHAIAAYDMALITMNDSALSWNGDMRQSENSAIYLNGNAKLVLDNSTISTFQQPISPDSPPGIIKNLVYADNSSTVIANDSTIDQIYVGDTSYGQNSTIQLTNCTGDFVEIDGGTPQISLTNTNMTWIDNFYGTPQIRLNNCNVTQIDDNDRTKKSFFSLLNTNVGTLNGYGEIRLDNSQVKQLNVDYAREVYVVWRLPLFGQILVPYAWAPYILPTIILAIAIPVAGTLLAVRIRHRRGKQGLKQNKSDTGISDGEEQ